MNKEALNLNWEPGKVFYKQESIINATEQYILNAIPAIHDPEDIISYSRSTEKLYKKFPYANPLVNTKKYNQIQFLDQLGNIKIMGDTAKNEKQIINMFTQLYAEEPWLVDDSLEQRFKGFQQSLEKVFALKNLESIALADRLAGCNLMLGKINSEKMWPQYLKTIENLASNNKKVKTVIYLVNRIGKKRQKLIDDFGDIDFFK